MSLYTYTYILYHFQKRCIVKAIRYENPAELFVLNRKKRPIRYEFHNGMKSKRYNGNMVIDKKKQEHDDTVTVNLVCDTVAVA